MVPPSCGEHTEVESTLHRVVKDKDLVRIVRNETGEHPLIEPRSHHVKREGIRYGGSHDLIAPEHHFVYGQLVGVVPVDGVSDVLHKEITAQRQLAVDDRYAIGDRPGKDLCEVIRIFHLDVQLNDRGTLGVLVEYRLLDGKNIIDRRQGDRSLKTLQPELSD